MVAVEVLPVLPSSRTVTALVFNPKLVPVTFTLKVHVAPPPTVAAVKLTSFAPGIAKMLPPPQLPVRPFGAETTRPCGSVSVKAISVRLTVFGIGDSEA